MVLVVKNLSANTGDIRDEDSIPGSGRSPGGGRGNPLRYSCLANPVDREAWLVTVHRDGKSRTRLFVKVSDFHFSLSLSLLISSLGCFLAGEWSWTECQSIWDL